MFPAPSAASGDPPFDMIMSFSQITAPVVRSRLITLPPAAVQTPEAVTTSPPRVPQKVPGVNEALQRMLPDGPSLSGHVIIDIRIRFSTLRGSEDLLRRYVYFRPVTSAATALVMILELSLPASPASQPG